MNLFFLIRDAKWKEVSERVSNLTGIRITPSIAEECVTRWKDGRSRQLREDDWSDSSWRTWFMIQLEKIGHITHTIGPGATDVRLTCELHVFPLGWHENEEMREILASEDVKASNDTKRSRITKARHDLKAINRTADRVLRVE